MKKENSLVRAGLACAALFGLALGLPALDQAGVEKVVRSLVWTGQASVVVPVAGKLVYVDPLQLPKGSAPADVVLITHSHGDHLSKADILAVASEAKTVIAGPADVIATVGGFFKGRTMIVQPGTSVEVNGVKVQAVPAYNLVKTKNHPQKSGWLGYVIDVGGVRLYHTGDTERIPEMKGLACDIIMLPLGQTYTMNSVQEAADAARDTTAAIAIPIHFGMYEGSEADAQKFAALLAGTAVKVVRLEVRK